jgi:hypothetical protein
MNRFDNCGRDYVLGGGVRTIPDFSKSGSSCASDGLRLKRG